MDSRHMVDGMNKHDPVRDAFDTNIEPWHPPHCCGACDQGRKECQTPDACWNYDTDDSAPQALAIAMLWGIFMVGVAILVVLIFK